MVTSATKTINANICVQQQEIEAERERDCPRMKYKMQSKFCLDTMLSTKCLSGLKKNVRNNHENVFKIRFDFSSRQSLPIIDDWIWHELIIEKLILDYLPKLFLSLFILSVFRNADNWSLDKSSRETLSMSSVKESIMLHTISQIILKIRLNQVKSLEINGKLIYLAE